ncbi:MAG: ChaN family lipoprotein, partial [Bacteroidales bacterium]
MVTLSLIREMGPVITALICAGKIGSGMGESDLSEEDTNNTKQRTQNNEQFNHMKRYFILLLVSVFSLQGISQKAAYKLYKADGTETGYQELLRSATNKEIVLFGELHNNPICHWLQLQLAMDLYQESSGKLTLGAEMFERDNQLIIDEFLRGLISEQSFEKQARLWPNYHTDYKPLLTFAKEKDIPFIATNIPRRYASMTVSGGFESLDSLHKNAYQWIAPLPVDYDPELPAYKKMLTMTGMHRKPNENLPKAQAIKDATMAHFILENKSENNVFLHYHGTYHSNNYEGIYWYLKNYDANTEPLTIASVQQKDIQKLEENNHKLADFILVIPQNMTKTH